MSMWERGSTNRKLKTKNTCTRLQYDINVQQEGEKKRQAVVFVSSFHPRGGVFCILLFMAGRGGFVFFPKRDGAVVFFFRGGTGRLLFFSEAGRGGCFFFPRRDGAVVVFFRGGTGWLFFFFDGTGRGVFFFFFRGPGRDGCFWRWQFFWRDGAKSLHRPVKGGLNRPTSRPCKALKIYPFKIKKTFEITRQI